MADNSALGKGLNALIPSDEQEEQTGAEEESGEDVSESQLYQFEDGTRLLGRVAEVAVERIRPNPYQPRQEFKDEALDELAASIEELGVIQPITVRALGDGQFEIIAGERRLRAARRAGIDRLPAFIREASSEEMLEMALVVALGYQRLMEECGLTQEAVAEKVSKSRATVSNFLRLLRLPPRVQAALRDKKVAMGHARALIAIDDEDAQVELLEETIEEDLSVREVERRARDWHEDQEEDTLEDDEEPAPTAPPDREELQLEDYRSKLRSRFSTQVQITHKKDGEGTIEVSYYSEEDLERLVELMMEE
jgi:ParB family chromosome partitioning protein